MVVVLELDSARGVTIVREERSRDKWSFAGGTVEWCEQQGGRGDNSRAEPELQDGARQCMDVRVARGHRGGYSTSHPATPRPSPDVLCTCHARGNAARSNDEEGSRWRRTSVPCRAPWKRSVTCAITRRHRVDGATTGRD